MNNSSFLLSLICMASIVASCKQSPSLASEIVIPICSYKPRPASSPEEIYCVTPKYIHIKESDSLNASFSGIAKIIERNGALFLLEERNRKLVQFSMDGEPLRVMDYRGRGPNEYLQITDFDVDKHGNIWIVDSQKDKIFKYDKNFTLLSSSPFCFDIIGIHCTKDEKFIVQIASWDMTDYSGTELAVTDSNFISVSKTILCYPKNKDKNFTFSSTFSDSEEGFFFCDPIDDFLYEVSDSGEISNTYHFNFGPYTVPEKYKKDIDRNYDIINRDCQFIVGSYKVTKSFITCEVHSSDGWLSSILDKDNGTITSFQNISSGYMLVGQTAKGSIWQLYDIDGMAQHPSNVKQWLSNGDDVFAVYYEKE